MPPPRRVQSSNGKDKQRAAAERKAASWEARRQVDVRQRDSMLARLPKPDVNRISPNGRASLATMEDDEAATLRHIRNQPCCNRACGQLAISTIGFGINLSCEGSNFLDVNYLEEALARDDVMEYNARTVGHSPPVGEKHFNESKTLVLYRGTKMPKSKHTDAEADKPNTITVKVFKNMMCCVTGAKSAGEVAKLAEYCRGLAQAIKGSNRQVVIADVRVHLINSGMHLNRIVNRTRLLRNLTEPATECVLDMEKHAGVRFRLLLPRLTAAKYPKVAIFQRGYVMFIINDFARLQVAYDYVRKHLIDTPLDARVLNDQEEEEEEDDDDDML